jgi:3-oxoacyl-[acyl-carrier protein] reductase
MMKDKVAVVTGGSRGIGRAICVALARAGAHVALIYSSDDAGAERTVCELHKFGVDAEKYRCRVESAEETEKVCAEIIGRFGTVDVLVNNAGITRDALLLTMKEADFDDVIAVNLKGAYNMMRRLCPVMVRKRSGCVINISSVAGITGNAGQINYSSSKAGLIGMTKSAARELAPRGIRVNAIAPGFIATDMTKSFEGDASALEKIPLRRMGTPEEVGSLALFLAEAEYITGEVVRIDGGLAI